MLYIQWTWYISQVISHGLGEYKTSCHSNFYILENPQWISRKIIKKKIIIKKNLPESATIALKQGYPDIQEIPQSEDALSEWMKRMAKRNEIRRDVFQT